MSGRAYIFIFLGGEDVNSNHVHLANQENSRQHCLLEQQFLTTNNLEENSLFMALWFRKNYISKLYPIKFIVNIPVVHSLFNHISPCRRGSPYKWRVSFSLVESLLIGCERKSKIRIKQEAQGPHHSPEKTVQINKHI